MTIQNDTEFKTALAELSLPQQRQVGGLFVENVLPLSQDNRLTGLLSAVKRADVSEDELIALRQAAKSASVESYAPCGAEANWHCQAAHFVAEAAVACVAVKADHPAWHAAMHARMARTCAEIAEGGGTGGTDESQAQYDILGRFLES